MTQKIATDKEVKKEKKEETQAIFDYVDKQDKKIMDSLNQHIEESNESNRVLMTFIKSIDDKVTKLLNREK